MNERTLVAPSNRALSYAEILSLLEHALDGDEEERESSVAKLLDATPGEWAFERKRIRSALTLAYWQNIERLKQGRIDRSRFILMLYPVCQRFCTGMIEVTEEDRWVIALIEHDRYSWEDDPLAKELERHMLELAP